MPLKQAIPAEEIDIPTAQLSESERKLLPHFLRPGADGLVSGTNFVSWESGKRISDSTREFYLMTGCKLARLARLDMSDIAYRLAEHRQTQKEKKAAANPKPAKIHILDKVDHWPEPYRSTFRHMVWASTADDDALAEYYLRTGTVPLKRMEESRLKSIRFAVDRMFKWLAGKRLPVRIDDNMFGLWYASIIKDGKNSHASIASYIGRIKVLATIALPGQSLVYLEKTQKKHSMPAKREARAPYGTGKPVVLFDIADELNAEAEAALKDPSITSQQAALLYRDSIVHGLFAEIPLRGHNAVAMKFGHNYIENEDGTAIVIFYPDETKEDNIIGPFPISSELARRVRRWLDVFRPMVSPYAGDWIFPARCSEKGLSLCQLAKIVKRETEKSPHPIRNDAATEIYTELPGHRDYGRVMLGQKRQSSTDGYAQHANGRIAGRQYKEIRKHEISSISQSRAQTAGRSRTASRAQPAL